jgi:membrane associated rhomboid family serine protease
MKSIWNDIQFAYAKGNSAIRKLVIINIAVFVVFSILSKLPLPQVQSFLEQFYLPSLISKFWIQPWSLLSHIFIHSGFFHILSNMLWLFFIGRLFEDLLGNKHVFRVFILGGAIGGLLFLIVFNTVPGFVNQLPRPMVGASGGVTAVIIATAVFMPNYELRPFGLFSIQLKWIALAKVLFDLIALGNGQNDGGKLAHLGGAALGYLYIKWLRSDIRLPEFKLFKNTTKPGRKYKVYVNPEKPKQRVNKEVPSQELVDQILDKISKSGYESLSKSEKEILFKASNRE